MNPLLTDRTALDAQRARALRSGVVEFLHDLAIDDVKERLNAVNRTFTKPAIVGGWTPAWRSAFPDALHVPDADVLDLREGAHDLVIHAMSLHWMDDPVGQLVQMRRALQPDGLMLSVAPAGQTLHELRACLAEAEIAVTGGLSPRIVPMAELRDLGGLLQRAGFALPVADSLPLTVTYRNAFHLMAELRAMGEGNALADRRRVPSSRRLFVEAADRYAAAFPAEDGRIEATFELVVLTGWSPSDTQQKPLRPGSARNRLADALGVSEVPLPPTRDSAPQRKD